jgi:hypothetical protein
MSASPVFIFSARGCPRWVVSSLSARVRGPGIVRQNKSGAAAMYPCAANSSARSRRSLSTPWMALASTTAGTGPLASGIAR